MGLQKYRADEAGEQQSTGAVPWYTKWIGGPTLAKIKNCPIKDAGIPPRTVYVTGDPDTWFSIPGAFSYKGKKITGFISTDNNREYTFHIHTSDLEEMKKRGDI